MSSENPTSSETPSERGVVASWNDSARTGVITVDGGGSVTFTGATISAFNSTQSRHWPSMAAAYLLAGQRVVYKSNGGAAIVVYPDPLSPIVMKTAGIRSHE